MWFLLDLHERSCERRKFNYLAVVRYHDVHTYTDWTSVPIKNAITLTIIKPVTQITKLLNSYNSFVLLTAPLGRRDQSGHDSTRWNPLQSCFPFLLSCLLDLLLPLHHLLSVFLAERQDFCCILSRRLAVALVEPVVQTLLLFRPL